jgi:hypothetical protein
MVNQPRDYPMDGTRRVTEVSRCANHGYVIVHKEIPIRVPLYLGLA